MGRRISTYSEDININKGDRLIGSDGNMANATKQFGVERFADYVMSGIANYTADGWVLDTTDGKLSEAFVRTVKSTYTVADQGTFKNVGFTTDNKARINISDPGFFSSEYLVEGARIVVLNDIYRFTSEVETIGSNYIILEDEIPEDIHDFFLSNLGATLTLIGNVTTVIEGNLEVTGELVGGVGLKVGNNGIEKITRSDYNVRLRDGTLVDGILYLIDESQ